MFTNTLALSLIASLTPAAQAPEKEDFQAALEAAAATFDAVSKESTDLLLDGKLAESERVFTDLIPKEKRTAAQAFVLGSMLYAIDFELSYALYEEANAKQPHERRIEHEWALVLHRAEKYAEAEALYARLLAGDSASDPQLNALRADCLLHLGRPQDAVLAWDAADARRNHSEIEEAVSWVYSKVSPETRRCRLLADVRSSRLEAVEALILLDLQFDRDLWNTKTNKEYLEHDLPIAAAALGKDSNRYKELELLARNSVVEDELAFMRGGKPVAAKNEALKKAATALGLLGDEPRLAVRSEVASHLFELFVRMEIVDAEQLAAWFQKEARARTEAKDARLEDWKLLAALLEESGSADLDAVDRKVAETYGDPDFASSWFSRNEPASVDDPLLVKVLAQHPDDPDLLQVALHCAMKAKQPTAEWLQRLIRAEFPRMASYHGAQEGFAALKKELAAAKK